MKRIFFSFFISIGFVVNKQQVMLLQNTSQENIDCEPNRRQKAMGISNKEQEIMNIEQVTRNEEVLQKS
jgi:hypothetical protein